LPREPHFNLTFLRHFLRSLKKFIDNSFFDMANPQPGKRQRTEEPTNFNATKIEIWEALTKLDASFTQQLLFRLAMSQPRVASEIWESYQSELQKERTLVLDFGIHAEEVETALNEKYGNLGGSKQFELADDVIDQILRSINAIQEEATKANASFGTRKSGLETLRNIGEAICTSNGVIPQEVIKSFQHDPALEDAMLAIVGCMTIEQRSAMAKARDGSSEFREKMRDLVADGDGLCIFGRVGDVLSVLEGAHAASNNGQGERRDTVVTTREPQPHVRDYYSNLQAGFVSNGAGIAAMNQFTASHNVQLNSAPHGSNLPAVKNMPAAQHYAPQAATPASYGNSTYQPQHVSPRPNPYPAAAYYSAPPYQPALGNLATRQYSATPPYQVDPRYTNPKYPPTAAPLASQAYPDQYWTNKPSYQPPGQQ
jgi:hypothetical protein